MSNKSKLYLWNKKRKRTKSRLKLGSHPRLVVYRSNVHIYAQVIDDNKNTTLASISSNDKKLNSSISKVDGKVGKSKIVGESLAQKLKEKKISQVIFDRNGYKFHGRVKALADSIRESGIKL